MVDEELRVAHSGVSSPVIVVCGGVCIVSLSSDVLEYASFPYTTLYRTLTRTIKAESAYNLGIENDNVTKERVFNYFNYFKFIILKETSSTAILITIILYLSLT